jgi:hypothetical protein
MQWLPSRAALSPQAQAGRERAEFALPRALN